MDSSYLYARRSRYICLSFTSSSFLFLFFFSYAGSPSLLFVQMNSQILHYIYFKYLVTLKQQSWWLSSFSCKRRNMRRFLWRRVLAHTSVLLMCSWSLLMAFLASLSDDMSNVSPANTANSNFFLFKDVYRVNVM